MDFEWLSFPSHITWEFIPCIDSFAALGMKKHYSAPFLLSHVLCFSVLLIVDLMKASAHFAIAVVLGGYWYKSACQTWGGAFLRRGNWANWGNHAMVLWCPLPLLLGACPPTLEAVLLPYRSPTSALPLLEDPSVSEKLLFIRELGSHVVQYTQFAPCASTSWMPLLITMENVEIPSSLYIPIKRNVQKNVCPAFKVRGSGDGPLGASPL